LGLTQSVRFAVWFAQCRYVDSARAAYLQIKTEGDIQQRCQKAVMLFAIVTLVIFALAGVWIANIDGYAITSTVLHDAPSNPLNKVVEKTLVYG